MQDLNGDIVTWNHGAETLYGWSKDEAIKMKYEDIVAESSKPLLNKVLTKLKQGERVEQYEAQRITKQGKRINVLVTPTILYSEFSHNKLIAFSERDNSKQQESIKLDCLSCMQGIASALIDAKEAVILYEPSGQIVAWNEYAEALYGWNSQEAVNMTIFDMSSEAKKQEINEFISMLAQGKHKTDQLTTTRITKAQHKINVSITATILKNSNSEALLIISNEQAV